MSGSRAGPGCLLRAVDRVEQWPGADGVIDAGRAAVRSLPLGGFRDVLHGRWLGHPLHPALVQLPTGAWISAAVLDLVPGQERAARTLVGVGLATAGPAAWAGWTDWAELRRPQQRVGVVHAAANAGGVILYGFSYAARARGRFVQGRAWGLAGLALVGAGGALGGHMAYRQGAGTNHAEAVPDQIGTGWYDLGELEDLPVGRPVKRHAEDEPLVVVREAGGAVRALTGRCGHMGGPLFDGEIADGCVRCPWHGSRFRLVDGWNVEGPATAPQPAFETRVTDGHVEARLIRRSYGDD
ncbi:Rieske (2Fe-2S) protein [Streptomyces sp. APSN-46.1]|uniref:Rieske (2Fe-2S) protein n=1 Tax=Streptomyces sp. APSN-46.1 TaxID=2929049 RepID=UPI001FB1A36C|nr:Rieske (2Fe-2S) protein [Streptomyces sp. APSN-46.1]MCJ1676446.1 Rieske (2Fe-2S) protein [Streptomyces sp. APSN-46.1]